MKNKLVALWVIACFIKLIVAFISISFIAEYVVLGIIGILAFILFVYEQIQMYKELSK